MIAYLKRFVGHLLIDIGRKLVASSREIPIEPTVTYTYGPENHSSSYRW